MAIIKGIITHIKVGKYELIRSPKLKILAGRYAPFSCVEVTVSDPKAMLGNINKNDEINILYGHKGGLQNTWAGSVRSVCTNKDQSIIYAVGNEKLLSCQITQSWNNETPEAILTYAANFSGININKIDSPGCVFQHFVASNISIWELAKQLEYTCRESFNIDMENWVIWLGQNGLNWGNFIEAADIPVISSGKNLIEHKADNDDFGFNYVETFLLPCFWHSMIFRLVDVKRKIDARYQAIRVNHEISNKKVRTFIWYKNENK